MRNAKFITVLLKIILNHMDDGVHVVDENGITVYYNQTMATLEGTEPKKVINKSLLEVFPFFCRETSTLLKVLKTGRPIYEQRQIYTNLKGVKITTINSTFPIRDKSEIIGAVEISKDVSNIEEMSGKIIDLQEKIYHKKDKDYSTPSAKYTFSDIIGESDEIKEVISYAKKASMTPSSVLIFGETGTGKELFAQSIHNEGYRRTGSFIAQNCAALPESLLEGILFGTVKGGFTGAIDRPGLFEQADGGTLLLDEINSMGMGLQAKLLRVLQEGYVRRIGDLKEIKVDVRIIATTNIDPLEAVEKGFLREDLFYRLNVVSLRIPPLRERKKDIIILTDYFINMYNSLFNKKVRGITSNVNRIFMTYNWPGNVRELQNVIESAMNVVKENDYIDTSNISPYLINNTSKSQTNILKEISNFENVFSLVNTMESIESSIIAKALQECDGNVSQAAERLDITRQGLQYKIKKYGLDKKKTG